MIFIQEYCKSKNIKLLYFRSVMDETLDTDSLMKLSNKAFLNRTDPDIEKMGIKHNYEKLQKLIGKLDKNIWINEFWYSMRDHIEKNFPGQIKAGYTHALPVEAVKDWSNLVKKPVSYTHLRAHET